MSVKVHKYIFFTAKFISFRLNVQLTALHLLLRTHQPTMTAEWLIYEGPKLPVFASVEKNTFVYLRYATLLPQFLVMYRTISFCITLLMVNLHVSFHFFVKAQETCGLSTPAGCP